MYLVDTSCSRPHGSSKTWNSEEIEILRREWANGLTAREIGAILGKTRNSIIGKAHRLDLEGRVTRASGTKPKSAPKAPKRLAKPKPPKREHDDVAAKAKAEGGRNAPVFYKPAKPLEGRAPISIRELSFGTCRAIVGHDNGIHRLATYCGAECFPGKSFCPSHCALYYAPDRRRA